MKYSIDPKYTLFGLGIAAAIGFIISALSNLPFWAATIIVAVAMFLNGLLAQYEDNLPGGFNNPMSQEEIKREKKKRNKKLLPYRIAIWGALALILIWLLWIYATKKA
jgi:NAD/NADP transhydrogenase alpha subunit